MTDTLESLLVQPRLLDCSTSSGSRLDHAMWFHRPFRADEWLLYDRASPTARGGRGLSVGRIFSADGRWVASVIQEGVIRVPRDRAPTEPD